MNLEVLIGTEKVNWVSLEGVEGSLELTEDPLCSFKQFLKIITNEEFDLVPKRYRNLTDHFVSSSYVAPLLMPRAELKSSLSRAERIFKDSISESNSLDYLESWLKIEEFLRSLKRAKVDEGAVRNLISQRKDLNSKNFESFLPEADGMSRKIKYNCCGTVTGRLTVGKGPQILTTDSSIRSCFRSFYKSGKVYSVDFTSIEPRVAMIMCGKIPHKDVYQDILEEFPNLNRDIAKIVTLTALYGGSDLKVSESVGDLKLAKKAISFVRTNFGLDDLEKRLEEESRSGVVKNAIGRPLREATKNKRVRVNHYLQSSAAEISILMFYELCKKFPKKVRPLFVIHDALIVDVSEEADEEFKKSCEQIFWKNVNLPVKIENLFPN